MVQGQFWKLWDKSQNSYFGLKISKATRRRGGEGRKERKEKRRKEKTFRAKGSKVRCDYFSPSLSSSSNLQVESRERSQGKPKTSKFLMVGKLDFDVFHT